MEVEEAIKNRRTIRSFKKEKIDRKIIGEIINFSRFLPSASNSQPLEYVIVDDNKLLEKVFDCLSWAGNVEWNPGKKEMPQSYIVILTDKDKNYKHDSGIASLAISLLAFEKGLGSCILGSIEREKLRQLLEIPENYEIDLVVALGYPKQESKIEEFKGETKYWKDGKGNFHVPKRKLSDILHTNKFNQ